MTTADAAQLNESFKRLAWSALGAIWVFREVNSDGVSLTIQFALAGFFTISALVAELLETWVAVTTHSPSASLAALRVLRALKFGLLVIGYLWLLAGLARGVRIV